MIYNNNVNVIFNMLIKCYNVNMKVIGVTAMYFIQFFPAGSKFHTYMGYISSVKTVCWKFTWRGYLSEWWFQWFSAGPGQSAITPLTNFYRKIRSYYFCSEKSYGRSNCSSKVTKWVSKSSGIQVWVTAVWQKSWLDTFKLFCVPNLSWYGDQITEQYLSIWRNSALYKPIY